MAALKDYRLNGYPKNEEGAAVALPFADYLEWLADYLYEADAQLTPEQDAMFAGFQESEPYNAMVGIGMDAGLHDNLSQGHPCYEWVRGQILVLDSSENNRTISRSPFRFPGSSVRLFPSISSCRGLKSL